MSAYDLNYQAATTAGQRIAELRERKGESQEQLAAALGVSRPIIQHWERGTRYLKADAIIKLAMHFGVSTDYLLGLSSVETPDTDLHAVCDYTGLSEKAVMQLRSGAAPYVSFILEDTESEFMDDVIAYMNSPRLAQYIYIDGDGGIVQQCKQLETPPEGTKEMDLGEAIEQKYLFDIRWDAFMLKDNFERMKEQALSAGFAEESEETNHA